MIKVSLAGKVRLEQRPEESEGAGPAAMGDEAFPMEGKTKVTGQGSVGLFEKSTKEASVTEGE